MFKRPSNRNHGIARLASAGAIVALVVGGLVGLASPASASTPHCNDNGTWYNVTDYLYLPVYLYRYSVNPLCILKVGDYNNDGVQSLQWGLNACYGQHLALDGDFGSLTKAALQYAQHKANVTADGVYGPITARAINHPTMNGLCSKLR
jgi:peptidoglycan hydrolase-like protein with peptidoglycan-binding domain